MTKHRSPNYPAISLEEAMVLAMKIWNKEKRTALSSEAAAIAMGYASLSGAARPKLSALKKYGLLEKSGRNYRISDLALKALHGTPKEKVDSLTEAIKSDKLFAYLINEFPEASADTLKSVLITKHGFSDDGAVKCTTAFLASKNLAFNGHTSDNGADEKGDIEVGSYIQWTSNDVAQFSSPKKVVGLEENWVFIEGSQTGIPMSEVSVVEPPVELDSPPTNPFFDSAKLTVVAAGSKQDRMSLGECEIVVTRPEKMTNESFDDLKSMFDLLARSAKRSITPNVFGD